VTFAAKAILKAMANYNNGGWYYGNSDVWSITFHPGATLDSDPTAGAPAISKASVKSANLYNRTKINAKELVFERDAKSVKVSATVSYERNPNRGESLKAKKGPSVK
nr:hypothetical protein [Bacteroidales bacterium]